MSSRHRAGIAEDVGDAVALGIASRSTGSTTSRFSRCWSLESYSPKLVEGVFSEVRNGRHLPNNTNIRNMGDAPVSHLATAVASAANAGREGSPALGKRARKTAKTNHLGALASGLLLAALMVACLLLTVEPAHAATFTVNSIADREDENAGDGSRFTGVLLVGVGIECTLRAAIEEANQTLRADTINIAIPGNGPHTMTERRMAAPYGWTVPVQSSHKPSQQVKGGERIVQG
jgi:CSLREA domain-containing protein